VGQILFVFAPSEYVGVNHLLPRVFINAGKQQRAYVVKLGLCHLVAPRPGLHLLFAAVKVGIERYVICFRHEHDFTPI
jgi:hypothetical protein